VQLYAAPCNQLATLAVTVYQVHVVYHHADAVSNLP